MEPYDNKQNDNRDSFWPKGTGAMIPGAALVGIGALFLLDNLRIVHVSTWIAYWPVILIAVGLVQLVDSSFTAGRIVGGVLAGIGALFLGDSLGYFRIDQMWPLILIAVGLFMLWTRTRPGYDYRQWWDRSQRYRAWAQDRFTHDFKRDFKHDFKRDFKRDMHFNFSGNAVHEYAIFGGSRRVVTDQDFKGGRVSSVFGGVFLDLRGANMVQDTALLEMASIYGGATIYIPLSWNVEVRGVSVFGGFSDQTVHPPVTPETKRLIVKGAAVFGGVTIKN
jgi:predicted membrane protein